MLECGRFDATSKTCHACQYYYKDLILDERTWVCNNCSMKHDRDANAAINIRQMALLKTVKGLEDGTITFPSSSNVQKGLSASGNGVPKTLSPYPLHKDLAEFIEHGGLTSLLALDCVKESQTREVLISSKQQHCL